MLNFLITHHSQNEITSKETLPTLINQIFQEEQSQSDDSQMPRDEQNMTEGDHTIDNVVSESLCQEEKGVDDDKQLEKEQNFEVVAYTELQNPVLQDLEEGQSNTQQDADIDKTREAFKLEEAALGEPRSPGIEDTFGEKQCTTVEKSDSQNHPLSTQRDKLIRLKENIIPQLKGKDFTLDKKEDNIEELLAEMEMANEPVTVLDDEFDELEKVPGTEMVEQKPATVADKSDDILDATKAKEHNDFQKKETGLEGNEEPHKPGKENQMNEKPKVNGRDFEFSLTDRVKELKQAMECGMSNVDLQPPKQEDWRPVRVPPYWRQDDNWIKKEPKDAKEPEAKGWRKEIKPVRKDIWELEMGHLERSPEKKSLPKKEDWIKELKSVIKDESLPKKRDEQVKKKRVVLLEDGHSYFPQLEQRNETKEEGKLSCSKTTEITLPPTQDSTENQDQAYEISLYVKVKNDEKLHVHSIQQILKAMLLGVIEGIETPNGGYLSSYHLHKGCWACTHLEESSVVVKLGGKKTQHYSKLVKATL